MSLNAQILVEKLLFFSLFSMNQLTFQLNKLISQLNQLKDMNKKRVNRRPMDLPIGKGRQKQEDINRKEEDCCGAKPIVCLTFMRRHQQVDGLGRQTGPNLVDLPLQVSVVQALSQDPCLEESSHHMCSQQHPRPRGKPM